MTSPTLDERLTALTEAAHLVHEHVAPTTLEQVAEVIEATRHRRGLGAELTVVALAGSTGSGKSSLFNAIAGLDLAQTGVHRPTTAHAMACVWGDHDSAALLDWLGVAAQRRVRRRSVLDVAEPAGDMDGLVLLDLPDHDSMVRQHRDEVDRLVARADVLMWVTDPVKYADAVLHEEYLASLRRHGAVVMVVLNQVDRLREADATACQDDLARLAERDGLTDVDVRAVSAASGQGVPELVRHLQRLVAAGSAAQARHAADAAAVAEHLAQQAGLVPLEDQLAQPPSSSALVDALARQWQVDARAQALGDAQRHRAEQAMRWPWRRARTAPGPPLGAPISVRSTSETVESLLVEHVARSTQPLPAAWGEPLRARLTSQSRQLVQTWAREIPVLTQTEPPAPAAWASHRRMQWALLALVGLAGVAAVGSAAVGGLVSWTLVVALLVVLGAAAGAAVVLNRRRGRLVSQWARQTEEQADRDVVVRLRDDVVSSLQDPAEDAFDEVRRARLALRIAAG